MALVGQISGSSGHGVAGAVGGTEIGITGSVVIGDPGQGRSMPTSRAEDTGFFVSGSVMSKTGFLFEPTNPDWIRGTAVLGGDTVVSGNFFVEGASGIQTDTYRSSASTTCITLVPGTSQATFASTIQVNANAILSSTGATALQWAADGSASTLSGRVTADGGIDIDNFTIDGSSIELTSGNLTVDVAGDIFLDADGDNIWFKAGGTTPLEYKQENSGDWRITNDTAQKSLIFRTRPSNGYMEVMRFDCGSDNSDVTFNESGARLFDFRVESGGVTAGKDHMFFVDGYNDRIGMGITSGLWNSGRPASRLHVEHTDTTTAAANNQLQDFTLFLKNLSDTTNSFAGIAFDTCSEAQVSSIGAAIRAERDSTADATSKHDANLTFATNDAGDDGLTERMRITHDGLVGIGMDPTHTLDVAGSIRSSGDLTVSGGDIFGPPAGTLSIRSNTTMQFHIDDDGGESSKEFQWYDDTTERMVLDQSGNLQIDGDLTVTGNRITFGNGEYINNESNGYLMMGDAHVVPSAGDTYDLGSAVYDWRDVYIGRGIQTPDGPLQITPGSGTGHNTMGSIRLMEESANGTNYLEIGCKYHVQNSNYTVEFPSASGDILVSGYTGAQSVGGSFRVNGGTIYGPADDMLELRTDGHMYFVIDDDNDEEAKEFRWYDDSTERMTLGQTGDLQIDGDLTVTGNRITFGNSGFIHEEVNGLIHLSENTEIAGTLTIPDYIYHAGDTDTFTHFGTNVWSVYTAGTQRIMANSNGIGIGGNVVSGYKLAVEGAIAGSGSTMEIRSLNGWAMLSSATHVYLDIDQDNNTSGQELKVRNGSNTEVMSVNENGYMTVYDTVDAGDDVYVRGIAYNSSHTDSHYVKIYYQNQGGNNWKLLRYTSTAKVKKNIVDMPNQPGLQHILQLNPRMWDSKNGKETDCKGFIAEEVYDIHPDFAALGPDFAYDHDAGKTLKREVLVDDPDGMTQKRQFEDVLDSDELVPNSIIELNIQIGLINSIKELKEQNDALLARIEALESS